MLPTKLTFLTETFAPTLLTPKSLMSSLASSLPSCSYLLFLEYHQLIPFLFKEFQ
jgi:hypothetical protein